MKIAIVHDDFMQWGGAERLVLALSEMYPQAPIYTALYDEKVLPQEFPRERLIVSGLQKHWLFRKIYRPFFFLHPLIFENFKSDGFDVVLSSTTRFAKSIIVKPPTIHICYCNTPPRFLWNFNDYINSKVSFGLMRALYKAVLTPIISYLRLVDQTAAQRVDYFIGNSENVGQRIKKYYQRESQVIYPFVDLERFGAVLQGLRGDSSDNLKGETLSADKVSPFSDAGYYLIISRLSPHKRVDLAIKTFNDLGLPLKIVGQGPELEKYRKMAKPNVEVLGYLSDESVIELLKNCEAFIYPQEEDFGITALEAQACGKPVIAFRSGGALETVVENQTGIFFNEQTVESLKSAIEKFEKIDRKTLNSWAINCRENVKRFGKERFCSQVRDFVNQRVELAKREYNQS